ncbi:hypothetical protein [Streptomyces olivaceoviridis]
MFAAGLRATVPALRGVFADIPLLAPALIANMVVIPLLGWGIGALFGLPSAASIALVLIASSPGGPFGAKLATGQQGDVVAGAATQVLLASLGSLTFAPTVNAILTAADIRTEAPSTSARWCGRWRFCHSFPSPSACSCAATPNPPHRHGAPRQPPSPTSPS